MQGLEILRAETAIACRAVQHTEAEASIRLATVDRATVACRLSTPTAHAPCPGPDMVDATPGDVHAVVGATSRRDSAAACRSRVTSASLLRRFFVRHSLSLSSFVSLSDRWILLCVPFL